MSREIGKSSPQFNVMARIVRVCKGVFANVLSHILLCGISFAQPPKLPANYPPGQYDESKVPQYTLPDPLVLSNGAKVSDAGAWRQLRRKEILRLFETYVYGRDPIGRPRQMAWEKSAEARNDTLITRTIRIFFAGAKSGPGMNLRLILPVNAVKPVPLFLVPGWMRNQELLFQRGYGLAVFNPWEVEPDRNDTAYANSIRSAFPDLPKNLLSKDAWGTIGVWAWAMSRAMDYLETDPDIDAGKICIMGLSRYGKVAMWAGAQDERFAIVFSCESGCGGAVIVRRGFGETVKSINGYAPHWFNAEFKKYGESVAELPVDWHMLVALMAPRPVYIATAEEDYWGDPYGSFLAAQGAEPVYALFGKAGLGVSGMPPVEVPVGNTIGYHMRKGGHGLNAYDWERFLDFADRHLGSHDRKN
jgi:hypothetical protein